MLILTVFVANVVVRYSSVKVTYNNGMWLCLVAEKIRLILNLRQMSESTKPRLNEAENGNSTKPMLCVVNFFILFIVY